MTQKIVPVIMAGGKGTRLWPLSRAAAPKQFITFIGDKTLFQETLLRVSDPTLYFAPVILTNEEFRFLVAEQARELDIALTAVLLEPVARNTAAAVAAAATLVRDRFNETVQMLRENESIYVPLGEIHRIANPGKIMLELVEVQTGSYLGEDDIIRIVDEFGRA